MTIPTDRPGTALLIVDVQVGVMEPSIRCDEVVANISTLVDRAGVSTPVVWVMHGDDESNKALRPGSSFPSLQSLTPNQSCTRPTAILSRPPNSMLSSPLLMSGRWWSPAQTDACITSTLHGAAPRLRRRPRQRCPHHRGPERVGRHRSCGDLPRTDVEPAMRWKVERRAPYSPPTLPSADPRGAHHGRHQRGPADRSRPHHRDDGRGPEGPIFMVNLLKFNERPSTPTDAKPTSAGARRTLYGQAVSQIIREYDGEVIFVGDVTFLSLGQVEELWDEVAIAKYPNRAALWAMSTSPGGTGGRASPPARWPTQHRDRQQSVRMSDLQIGLSAPDDLGRFDPDAQRLRSPRSPTPASIMSSRRITSVSSTAAGSTVRSGSLRGRNGAPAGAPSGRDAWRFATHWWLLARSPRSPSTPRAGCRSVWASAGRTDTSSRSVRSIPRPVVVAPMSSSTSSVGSSTVRRSTVMARFSPSNRHGSA